MKISFTLLAIIFLLSCSVKRKESKFVDGIQGAWNLADYKNDIDLDFYDLMVVFESDGQFQSPGRTGTPFEFGKWQVVKVFSPDSAMINISLMDTLFAGNWTVKNFEFSNVKRYSSMMLYMELHQGNKVFILDRYSH